MTQSEIQQEISLNNNMIRQVLTPNEFVLNGIVSDLIMRNRELQEECGKIGHHFDENGTCFVCSYQRPAEEENNAE